MHYVTFAISNATQQHNNISAQHAVKIHETATLQKSYTRTRRNASMKC